MVRSVPSSPTLSRTTTHALGPTSKDGPTEPFAALESLDKDELIQLVKQLNTTYETLRARFENGQRSQFEHDPDENDSEEVQWKETNLERQERIEELEKELQDYRERESETRRDQERMEEELAGRIEVLEKLRSSVRDLEKDKRDTLKRYKEQSVSFDSERQSWYDQEQHLKLRIQNLSSQRKSTNSTVVRPLDRDDEEPRAPGSLDPSTEDHATTAESSSESRNASSCPPAASGPTPLELSLQTQLDTLTTAHASLSTTLRTLQIEMTDLKRVYNDLQEENESYEILLGEKTLSGAVTDTDFFRKSFSWGESGVTTAGAGEPNGIEGSAWTGFGFQGGLEAVGEEEAYGDMEESDGASSDNSGSSRAEDVAQTTSKFNAKDTPASRRGSDLHSEKTSPRRSRSSKHSKRRTNPVSETLASGLDLAAELEAAQGDEESDETEIARKQVDQAKRERRREQREISKRKASAARRDGSQSITGSLEELHLEIKQLREANKALTLYVSKIVERVCSQEGFEKVLAVDYRTNNATPKADNNASPTPAHSEARTVEAPVGATKPRPVSTSFFSRSSPGPGASTQEPLTPKTVVPTSTGLAPTPSSASSVGSNAAVNGPRRSGGLTWDGISSVFGFGSSSSTSPNIQLSSNSSPLSRPATTLPPDNSARVRPLLLSSPDHARRLSISDEDEDDIVQRERLRIDMSRHGIDYAPTLAQIGRPRSSSSVVTSTAEEPVASTAPSLGSPPVLDPIVEAQNQWRARQEQEEQIKQQIVKEGKGSGLTEAPPRRMTKLERRHSSRGSSISYNLSPSSSSAAINGLGIDSLSPTSTNSVADATEETAKEADDTEEGQKWTKALRRMSRGWASPPVS